MSRLFPWIVLAVGCSGVEVGDSCASDEDCDVDNGLFCDKATDATADEEGECVDLGTCDDATADCG